MNFRGSHNTHLVQLGGVELQHWRMLGHSLVGQRQGDGRVVKLIVPIPTIHTRRLCLLTKRSLCS